MKSSAKKEVCKEQETPSTANENIDVQEIHQDHQETDSY